MCSINQTQDTKELLDELVIIAYDMIVAGSEVGKVEKEIERMCRSYGMEEVEVFIITSSIIVSVRGTDNELCTLTKRIRKYSTDFYRIELLEELINHICKERPLYHNIRSMRMEIEGKVYFEHHWNKKIISYFIFCFVSMIFTLFFKGTLADAVSAFLCGIFIKYVYDFGAYRFKNNFMVNILASTTGGIAAGIFYKFGIAQNIDKVMIGNIMLLIPGLATVNAIKDLIGGETITGLLRLADAFVQAVAVAVGFAGGMIIMGIE